MDSIVRISELFQISLDELLLENAKRTEEKSTLITLEDLTKINDNNRKMSILLISGILFMVVSIMMVSFVFALRSVTLSTT